MFNTRKMLNCNIKTLIRNYFSYVYNFISNISDFFKLKDF